MEPQSRKRPKEKKEREAKKVCHRMHDIRSFLHNADSKSASPALVSRHDTQPLLAVAAASNDEAVIALASNLQPTYASSTSTSGSSSLSINSSDDDNTPLER